MVESNGNNKASDPREPAAPSVDKAMAVSPSAEARSHSPIEAAHSVNEDGFSTKPDLSTFIDTRLSAGTTNLYAEAIEEIEKYLFTRILVETNGNQSRAAEILGITRGKVRDRIAYFKIQLERSITIQS